MEKQVQEKRINEKVLRKSNFELLRILAMIMIIVHHLTCHSFKIQLEQSILKGEYFNKAIFFKRLLLPQFFMATGKIGNIIFILISGYFLINKKINIVKQIKKILSQLLFVTVLVVLGSFLYYKYHSPDFKGIQSFELFHTEYWFIGYYLGIIIIAKFFLNNFLNKLKKNEYIELLLAMLAIASISFLRTSISDISSNFITLFVGVFVYALGGFIRLYNPFKNVRVIVLLFMIIISITAICINNYNITLSNINDIKIRMNQEMNHYDEYNIFCLLIGVSIFEIFRRLEMKNNRVINYIASATLTTYLLHDNDFIRNVWRERDWIAVCYDHFGEFIRLYFVWVYLIFMIGVMMYTVYYGLAMMIHTKFLKRIIFKNLDRECDKVKP